MTTAHDYRPLRSGSLAAQLGVLVLAELALFLAYAGVDSRFHWAAHFLVGTIAAAAWLSAWLLLRGRPAPGQLLTVLVLHLYAMAPDIAFRFEIAHARWMNVFLGHVAVHYIPGGDRTWLVLAVIALFGYCGLLSRWLAARRRSALAGVTGR